MHIKPPSLIQIRVGVGPDPAHWPPHGQCVPFNNHPPQLYISSMESTTYPTTHRVNLINNVTFNSVCGTTTDSNLIKKNRSGWIIQLSKRSAFELINANHFIRRATTKYIPVIDTHHTTTHNQTIVHKNTTVSMWLDNHACMNKRNIPYRFSLMHCCALGLEFHLRQLYNPLFIKR